MTITIERLGHHGDGIAPGPVYAPLTLPGEVIDGQLDGDRIAQPKIITPSPDRVAAPCPHFRSCGGCALQHASDAFVSRWKVDTVRRALAAHGLDAPIRRIATSPPGSRRRASLHGRRTKKGALIGFHARASDTLIEVPQCRVLKPEIVSLLPQLGDLTRLGGSRKGTLTFAVTSSTAGADVSVTGGKPLDAALRTDLAQFTESAKLARLTWDGEQIAERAPPVQHFAGIAVTPPPGAFLQATVEGEAALQASVADAVANTTRIADLFAGCGTFALPLARTAHVHAVESAPELLAAADAAARHAPGLKPLTTETRDLFRRPLLPDELTEFDAVVIDPPRQGAEAQTQTLVQAGPPQIAMVSCNPVTFARDAATLTAGGYQLNWVDIVDQFRWSPHIELAARFRRDHMAG